MVEKPAKERVPRHEMPCLDPVKRRQAFDEVATGFTEDMAVAEAERCLSCKKEPCRAGCPVEIDIKGFLERVMARDFHGALAIIKQKNNLPGITGRVCPQESQCEVACTVGKVTGCAPVAIGAIERFVADWCDARGIEVKVPVAMPVGAKVAVIGSGPAGLTAAGDLAKKGFDVTVFEAFHEPGGVLAYGIPEFRLPKHILRKEIAYLHELGVKFKVDHVIGRIVDIDELRAEGYEYIFLGTGAGLPTFLGIPGETLPGVYTANEFLTRVNLMKAYKFPEYDTPVKVGKAVAVVGGGNVAMDAARTALRLGAGHVYLLYRRSMVEMPARLAEVHHAREEGITFKLLRNPVEILADDRKNITGIKVQEMTLGCLDESGRAACLPVEGAYEVIPVDTVIVAVGSAVNTICTGATCGLDAGRRGHVRVDPETQETSLDGVFAGGDVVTGSATVISAMGAAKKAARAIAAKHATRSCT